MQTAEFDYLLPPERIAQRSIEPRDHAQLLVIDRFKEHLKDAHVFDLPQLLRPNDLLVLNDTKVFKARLEATLGSRSYEVFLLRGDGTRW